MDPDQAADHRREAEQAAMLLLDRAAIDQTLEGAASTSSCLRRLAYMAGVQLAVTRDRVQLEVDAAREHGATWAEIATAIGISRAAVKARYGAGRIYEQHRRARRRAGQ